MISICKVPNEEQNLNIFISIGFVMQDVSTEH